jgi:hypothetical protein
MHLMQYEIGLPADYDMAIIERRVAERGSATDDFGHLGLKAYAVRRIGRHNSTVNAYAPFYFWTDPTGMNDFLYGPFRNIVKDFGRPRVRHWVGAGYQPGPQIVSPPSFAARRTEPIPEGGAPGDSVRVAVGSIETTDGLHSHAVGVDPNAWEIVHFTLWDRSPDHLSDEWTVFDVLHASTPDEHGLVAGRLW